MATCQITNPVTAILLVLVADRAPVCQVLEFVVEIMLLVVEEAREKTAYHTCRTLSNSLFDEKS